MNIAELVEVFKALDRSDQKRFYREIIYQSVLDAKEVAASFCTLSSKGQAKFFNEVARITTEWPASLEIRLLDVADESDLSASGRHVMHVIGWAVD